MCKPPFGKAAAELHCLRQAIPEFDLRCANRHLEGSVPIVTRASLGFAALKACLARSGKSMDLFEAAPFGVFGVEPKRESKAGSTGSSSQGAVLWLKTRQMAGGNPQAPRWAEALLPKFWKLGRGVDQENRPRSWDLGPQSAEENDERWVPFSHGQVYMARTVANQEPEPHAKVAD